ncbi:MAG: ATP-dependent DNA helicase RecG [Clostridia bacterium]|nr:ATP-dependent DNA helicase RecG [Clostridia bacterium]
MSDILKTDIRFLKGIGEKRAEGFRKLGISTIGELITFYPRDYEDWSKTVSIKEAPEESASAIKATVVSRPVPIKTRSGKLMYRTCATDGVGMMNITFFNNRFVRDDLKENEEFIFFGKMKENDFGGKEMLSPKYQKADKGEYIHPVYHQNSVINSKAIEKAIRTALDTYGDKIPETLPNEQILKYKLLGIKDALRSIHFPKDENDIKAAKRRLIYEELLILQLGILSHGKTEDEKTDFIIKEDYTKEFFSRLPFELTNAQKRAIKECMSDMKMTSPMRRLLQGDVGSGKTAVAAALMYCVIKNGYQCALMAPTEVLARQHFETFSKFFKDSETQIVLLTGSTTAKNKKLIKEDIASGKAGIVIGTHAVITGDTVFKNCALVITDEQHRFGVNQRAALREKGENPHVLVMSATPIPRTLSLIIYGDLSISVLDEKPKGRQEIKTVLVPSVYHERMYSFIKKEVNEGHQCYIVCPMVEESDDIETDRKSAQEYFELLSKTVFSDIRCSLLHGQMKQKQKDAVMASFKNGETDVLICTVVIEVGIDVPNASVIVIENAECFGLSQLHQLRGRVGRGNEKSYCILVSDAKGEEAKSRFDILCSTNDGFRIAEEDLKLRGPGDFFGSRQSGLPSLKIASLMTDSRILYAAREQAQQILSVDPNLQKDENKELKNKISALFADIS